MRVAASLVLALALTACGTWPRRDAPVGDADPACYAACTASLTDTGVRWKADPEDPAAWDELGDDVVRDLAGRLLACERRRQACADTLGILKQRGVLRAKE